MITEDYTSFETAKLLKEKGFDDEYTNAFYDKSGILYFIDILGDFSEHPDNDSDIAASTLYVAMKWLRDVHNIFIGINTVIGSDKNWGYEVFVQKQEVPIPNKIQWDWFTTYEEACEEGIRYVLENMI